MGEGFGYPSPNLDEGGGGGSSRGAATPRPSKFGRSGAESQRV